MSLFIGDLAFNDAAQIEAAKIGILCGSLVSGLLGFVLVRMGIKEEKAQILARRAKTQLGA
jgi:NhaA family Na+:H+ antiporter